MANQFFLDAQQATETAEILKFFSHFGASRVIELFMNQF